MLRERPGAYLWLGQGRAGDDRRPLHHPGYDFNDDALPLRRALVLRGRRTRARASTLRSESNMSITVLRQTATLTDLQDQGTPARPRAHRRAD